MRPRFDDQELNTTANSIINGSHPDVANQMLAIRSDWRQFVINNFNLTPQQAQHLRNIPDATAADIREAILQAHAHGGAMTFNQQAGSLDFRRPVHSSETGGKALPALDINITIFHCHFDADCGNWTCFWGPHLPNR